MLSHTPAGFPGKGGQGLRATGWSYSGDSWHRGQDTRSSTERAMNLHCQPVFPGIRRGGSLLLELPIPPISIRDLLKYPCYVRAARISSINFEIA